MNRERPRRPRSMLATLAVVVGLVVELAAEVVALVAEVSFCLLRFTGLTNTPHIAERG